MTIRRDQIEDSNRFLIAMENIWRKILGILEAVTSGTTSLNVDIHEIGGQSTPIDHTAMTAAPTLVPIGGEYRNANDSYTDGDSVIAHFDKEGRLKVTLEDDALDIYTIDNFSSITGWSASAGADLITLGTDHRGRFANSIRWDKIAGSTVSMISKTISPAKDISDFDIDALLSMWIKITTTNVASVSILLGTDGSNFNTYTVADTAITNETWQRLNIDINTPTSVNGTGLNMSSLTYIAVSVTFDNAADTLTNSIVSETLSPFMKVSDCAVVKHVNSNSIDHAVLTDDSPFVIASTSVVAQGLLVDETATDSVDEGDLGVARMTPDRKQITASEFKEDGAHTDLDYGTHMLAVRKDITGTNTTTDNDYSSLFTDQLGNLKTISDYVIIGTHKSPEDFTCTINAAPDTLTITGAPTITNNAQIKGLIIYRVNNKVDILKAGINGIAFSHVAGTVSIWRNGSAITISDPHALLATDTGYVLILELQDKAYDTSNDALKVITQNKYSAIEDILTLTTMTNFGSWVDIGTPIDMRSYTQLNVYLNIDINQATNCKFRCLGQTTAVGGATDEYSFVIETISSSDVKVESEYIEFNTDADQLVILKIKTEGVPYAQLQWDGGTDGGVDPAIIVKVNKICK